MAMYQFLEQRAEQFMTRGVITVTRQTTLGEMADLFSVHDFNAFPVMDAGHMVGIVTKFDFLKAFAFTTHQIIPHYEELMRGLVQDVMTEAVVDVRPDAPLTRIVQLMINTRARSFPVREGNGSLVGMISREDLTRALRLCAQAPEGGSGDAV
jgi:CBS-domain-containing membrane protein